MPTASIAEDPPLKLSFIPFEIETVVPVTPENIGEHGRTFLFQGQHAFVPKLRATLFSRKEKGQLLVKGIRLKADFRGPTGVILVDRNGVVLDVARNATFRLSREAMREIENNIQGFVGVVDVTAYEKEPGLKALK
jgi:hypothetical protein